MSGRLQKRLAIVFAVAATGLALYLFTRDDLEVADQSASVIGAFFGLAGLALALYGILANRPPASLEEAVTAAKEKLVHRVRRQWVTEVGHRLLEDPGPIPVLWHLVDDAGLTDHPHLVGEDLGAFEGSSRKIPELARFLEERLRRRRLVVTGAPGTGKTTLAVQLLLHLVRTGRDEADPVPVLVPVNGWDTTAHPRLHDWLAVRLLLDYPELATPMSGTSTVRVLLDRGHILPILDGLDEIPPPARVAVITALNRWLGEDDRLVVTSRVAEYGQAVAQAGAALNAAAVIAPAPITATAAGDYLRESLPREPRHDWTPVWAALEDRSLPGLSRLVETALGLWLIRAVYVLPAADPAPLTGFPALRETTLRAHLFDHLIPAVVDVPHLDRALATPFRPRTRRHPDHVRDHLTYLARLLRRNDTYDLPWWHLARYALSPAEQRRVTRLIRLAAGLAAGLALGFAVGPASGLAGGLVIGLAAGRAGAWFTETPGYADLRPSGRGSALVRHLRNGLVGGLAGALVLWGVLGGVLGLKNALASALVVGLTVSFVGESIKWAERPASFTAATTPLTIWKADRTLTLLRVLSFGLVGGLAVGLTLSFAFGMTNALAVVIVGGFVAGLLEGDHHAWIACTVTVLRLARRERVPRRLMAFLDDAHRLGLLRTVGPVYQFRHAEFQDHLAALPPPGSTVMTPGPAGNTG
ncbi:NACHT domain-containing protein [Streptosporangium sp. NPDC023615]|uniref:NACHT domain-containing protein n=1 Tax=Streptosporangium sp. NPDC023615 TaxID=3154794 RepID=UPI003418CA65